MLYGGGWTQTELRICWTEVKTSVF